jgi:hypothetical protein
MSAGLLSLLEIDESVIGIGLVAILDQLFMTRIASRDSHTYHYS